MFYCAVLRNLFLNQVFEAKRKICVWYANNLYEVCEINFEKRTINPRKTYSDAVKKLFLSCARGVFYV